MASRDIAQDIAPKSKYEYVDEIDSLSPHAQSGRIDIVRREEGQGPELYVRKAFRFGGIRGEARKDREYLLSEYRILSSLRHPFIVELADCEYRPQHARWEAYLFTEYCPKGDLANFMKSQTSTKWSALLKKECFRALCFQLTSALVYCHTGVRVTKGLMEVDRAWTGPVLHRDIKPANGMGEQNNHSLIRRRY